MLGYLTVIFVCQLAGELLAAALGLSVPGPVIGMLLLLGGLIVWGSLPTDLGAVADGLLTHLSLLFIPAGVGVMLHAGILGRDWLPISIALVVSTLLAIAVTAWTMVALERRGGSRSQEPGPDA
jgi:holin-like protein